MLSKESATFDLWEELSEKEKKLREYKDALEALVQEKRELEKNKPETRLVAKIICASGVGNWYDWHVGEEFDISVDDNLVRPDYIVITGRKPYTTSNYYIRKCDCMVYEKEIESVKEQKKDNTNKTYFEKQVDLYLKDLGGNPFSTLSIRGVSNCLDSLMSNHNVYFESKIVKIQSPESFGCPFKVFVKGMLEEQISFLQKLIMYSLPIREIVQVVEFVEHPFSKNI